MYCKCTVIDFSLCTAFLLFAGVQQPGYRPSCHWLFPCTTTADSIVSQLASRVAVPEVPESLAGIAYSVSLFS